MANIFNLDPIGANLFEAITLSDFKTHARVYMSADDDYIGDLIVAARIAVEKDLNQAIVGQNYDYHLENGFQHFYRWYTGPFYSMSPDYIYPTFHYPHLHLPIEPISKDYPVTITYTDTNGSPQTWDGSNYVVKYWKSPVELMIVPTTTIPGIQPGSDVVINFTAGFVTTDGVSTVPLLYKQAIQLLAAGWYENRESVSDVLIRDVPGYDRIKSLLEIKRFK